MCDGVMVMVSSCSKRKGVSARWISQYTIHACRREMGVMSVERYLFKTSA
ncbi:hypothetical protein [Bartonella gabonensis]|nr:hypothetical protein [Bartonella gabonensis]